MKNMRTSIWAGLLAVLAAVGSSRAASVTVDWDANTEPDLAGYRLYYAATSLLAMTTTQAQVGSVTKLTSSGAGTSITVNGLAEGTTYHFRLTAFDNAGEESDFGMNPLEISTFVAPTPPLVPTGLSATPMTPTRIDLAWNYAGASPTGFVVEWSVNNGASWTQIATPAGSARSYQSTVVTGVPYRYRVKAVKSGFSDSAYSTATGNVATSATTTPSGAGSPIPVVDRLLSAGKQDGRNDEVDFGDDAVEVRVMDAAGRTIDHGESPAGGLVWAGTDDRGVALRTGLYIAKVTMRDGTIHYEKILLVK